MKHRFLQKGLLIFLAVAMLTPLFGAFALAETAYDHTETFTITGYNSDPTSSAVIVFTNDKDAPRVIGTSDYAFRYAKVMIFDKNGVLIEAGGDLLGNKDGTNGSAQLTVTIPPRGFMVAFGNSAPKALRTCREIAMEGAMLYNATMSVIYPMFGSYDKASNKLTISYDDAETPSADAPRFLFVGNSTTYFNGTPIKFKAVCDAAGEEVVVEYCTYGSAYLSEFADPNHERGKALRNKLSANKYDYVVLQDAASADYTRSKAALDVIMPLIEANGAEALLYMRYSTSDDGTKRHYNNYPRLSKDFGLKVANVTGAFNICREKYPDINLLADDGGHHSCEGSYLIACTWLYAYLGIDPRGNSYTANLPEDTVAALQECAYEIVEQGLELPDEDYSFVLDGVKYSMLSKDKPYTADGVAYSGSYTDDNGKGKPIGKRTDGIFATAGDEAAIGCWKGTTTNVTIDLKNTSLIKIIRTDLWGNSSWGIPDPTQATVEVSYSTNGTEFVPLGEATRTQQAAGDNWKMCDFTLILDKEVEARYVRVTYNIAGNFCWSSEIGVYGTAPDESGRINLALGKEWYGDTETTAGTYSASLTDGVIDPEGKYDDTLWYAADNRKETDGIFTMMLDLGKSTEINEARIHVWPAGYSGIVIPTSIDFYASEDGETFEPIGSVTEFDGTDPQWVGVTPDEVTNARYIRVDMVGAVEGDTGVFWFVSELEVLEIPKHVHDLVHVLAIAPGCHYEGNIEYWHCTECKTVWSDEALTQVIDIESVTLPELGGDAAFVAAKEPTLDTVGNIAHWFCEGCGKIWTDEALTQPSDPESVTIPKLDRPNLALGKEVENATKRPTYHADLTDGIAFESLNFNHTDWFGFYWNHNQDLNANLKNNTNAIDGIAKPTINLGALYDVSAVRLHMFMGNSAGIAAPESITLMVSADGTEYETIEVRTYNMPASEDKTVEWVRFDLPEGTIAQYVCIAIDLGNTFAFLNEIEILGCEPDEVHSHNAVRVPAKAPTATENGNIEYWICEGCETVWTDEALTKVTTLDEVVLPATGETAVFGDIDGDGKVNAKDYMMVKRYVLGTFDLTDAQIGFADMDGNGNVKAKDYLMLKSYILGSWTPAK